MRGVGFAKTPGLERQRVLPWATQPEHRRCGSFAIAR
jgi:hypothetical protein